MTNPLQIRRRIIQPVEINVIYLGTFEVTIDECLSNNFVQPFLNCLTISG